MLPSTVIYVFLLIAGVFAIPSPHHVPGHPPRAPNAPFKLCVPERAYKPCLKMLEQGKSAGINMQCIEARDRMDCIEKIENHSADWGAMDPEDMYVAAKFANDLFSVFKEIRTKEEPSNQFRYEAVAVIHKDLEISELRQLQGLKSCHTGVGRNVGYKIPITKLTKMGILPPLNDTNISPRENELKALSTLFSKACLVGKWSPDPETNTYLKNKYNNLCALCQYPEKCDYPDDNSGYEGALNCLSKAGGDVAWTKIIYVKKFFGMAYGTQPARQVEVNPNDYAYLCPDATKKPLTGPPCTWAARPWQGYMANTEITGNPKELKELRDEIKTLNNIGETSHAEWISSVLALSNKTLAVDNEGPYSPKEYLDKAKYTDVIERDVMKPRRLVKLCVTSDVEKSKCLTLEKAAYSRDIRPQIECVQKSSQEECMNAVANKEADVLSIDAGFLKEAESKNLEPIASEIYESGKTNQYVVALVKKSSSFKSLNELKGAKACLSMKGEAAGWVTPINALLKKNAIQANDCPRTKSLSEFFSAVEQTKSAIECLMSGKDVAFVGCEELKMAKDNIKDFNPSDYNLIKLEGGDRCEIDKVEECNIGAAPARVLVSQKLKDLPHVVRDDILFTILAAGKTFSEDPEYFLMFGKYQNQPNILFSDFAKGFVNNQEAIASQEEFKKKLSEVGSCPAEKN